MAPPAPAANREPASVETEIPVSTTGAERASGHEPAIGGLAGFLVGGMAGFAMRPSALLVGQLPFDTVVSRGANLTGLDRLFAPTAEQSFNVMIIGAAVGAVAGFLLGRIVAGRRT